MQSFETIEVHETDVACDGGEAGHPRVYLHIDRNTGRIQCPYCSRVYVLKKDDRKESAA